MMIKITYCSYDHSDHDDGNLTELLVKSRVVGFKSGGGGGRRV